MWPRRARGRLLGVNYGPRGDPLAILQQRSRGAISVYAQGDDYHEVIKPRLKALAAGSSNKAAATSRCLSIPPP